VFLACSETWKAYEYDSLIQNEIHYLIVRGQCEMNDECLRNGRQWKMKFLNDNIWLKWPGFKLIEDWNQNENQNVNLDSWWKIENGQNETQIEQDGIREPSNACEAFILTIVPLKLSSFHHFIISIHFHYNSTLNIAAWMTQAMPIPPFRSHSQSSILHPPSSIFHLLSSMSNFRLSILNSLFRFIFTAPLVLHHSNFEFACPHFTHQHPSNIIDVVLLSNSMFSHDFLDLSNIVVALWMLKST
jgi:hypothetical protein